MSKEVYVAGVGMTPFGKHLDTSVKQMTCKAVEAALADAGCDKAQLQGAFFGNSTQGHMDGQHMIRGELALRDDGPAGAAGGQRRERLRERQHGLPPGGELRAGRRCRHRARRRRREDVLHRQGAQRSAPSTARGTCTTRRPAGARCCEMGHGIEPPPKAACRASPTACSWTSMRRMGRMHMREYRHDAAADRRRVGEESRALGAQPAGPVSRQRTRVEQILARRRSLTR